jgi:hypothetical protein
MARRAEFVGEGTEHHSGILARNLSEQELDALTDDQKRTVWDSALYRVYNGSRRIDAVRGEPVPYDADAFSGADDDDEDEKLYPVPEKRPTSGAAASVAASGRASDQQKAPATPGTSQAASGTRVPAASSETPGKEEAEDGR